MKKYIFLSICALLAVIFVSCQDEMAQPGSNVRGGLPARIKLSVKVPSADKVVNSRGIYEYESEIKELALFLFENTSGRKVFLDLTGQLTHKAYTQNGQETDALTETGGRIYTLSADIEGEELSGEYRLYAVANWSSSFCELSSAEDLKAMSEEALKSHIAENSKAMISLTGDERFPMSYQSAETVVIEPLAEGASEEAGTPLNISLRRLTSHIIFKFVNGQGTGEYTNPKFVPKTYSIYNIPKKANLFNKEDNIIAEGTFGNLENISVSESEFEFFMLENVQPEGTSTTYETREKWTSSETSVTGKDFSHAPENGTFIVVDGEYSDDKRFGEVSYTIHLGDFSDNDYKNFTVKRNQKHTYTVTVKGAQSIVTEANIQENEPQPGAEGIITERSEGSNFVLDAHYETIMLKFPLDDKCTRTKVIVKTPYDNGTYSLEVGENNPKDADYGWIQFMAPDDGNDGFVFPTYSNDNAIGVAALAQELKAAKEAAGIENQLEAPLSGAHYKLSQEDNQTYVHVVAFVDEYFYEDKDWTTFVDQPNRTLILNPEANTSKDGNSVYHNNYIFEISQRSIKTIYKYESAVSGFGLETWNETGKSLFSQSTDNITASDLTPTNGLRNTQSWLTNVYTIDWSNVGYFEAPADNSKDVHLFKNKGEYDGYYACLTRNRDVDGNGKIEGDELKWYLPAVRQYTDIWLARDKLHEDTRLFTAEDMTNLTVSNAATVNLFTSSGNNMALYWPAEGASYGHTNNYQQGVRCVRNLNDPNNTGELDQLVSNDETNRVISVLYASESSMRSTTMTGEYTGGHNEREADNKLYQAFEVAKACVGETVDGTEPISIMCYYGTNYSPMGQPWVTVTAKKSADDQGYNFAIYINVNDGEISFYENSPSGTPLTYTENSTENTLTCTVEEYEITVSKNSVSKLGYFIDLYLKPIEGYTYTMKAGDTTIEFDDGDLEEVVLNNGTSGDAPTYFNISEIKTGTPCATYTQTEDGSDRGQWRVPNQRELMLMARYEGLYLSGASQSKAYASRTFFSNTDIKTEPYSFNGHVTLQSDGNGTFVVRCVRDAISGTTQSTVNSLNGGQTGSGYGQGGNLFE